MKIIAHKMKIDIHESIKAAETKPFGFRAFNYNFQGHIASIIIKDL